VAKLIFVEINIIYNIILPSTLKLPSKKEAHIFGAAFVTAKKLPKVNNYSIVENSPNLVTLLASLLRYRFHSRVKTEQPFVARGPGSLL
jgi:hypothetical protein